MDINSFGIEFYDFENASEEEVKEIHAILKGPGNNGSVELPWKTTLKEDCTESHPEYEKDDIVEETDPSISLKSTKCVGSMVGPALHFMSPQAPLSPSAVRVPPPSMEAFIAPPTSVGPFPNTPYIMSRTIPYLRAYHHMGIPFFACPIPGNTGEASPITSPYGQFVPLVPATVAQEKFVGLHVNSESTQKNRPVERQCNRRSKKKSSSDYSPSFESETLTDAFEEVALDETESSPMSNDRPTSVPIVPLPVPPTTFGMAGGTIPLHGYPPGLHTLPYPQMTGPQAPSPAMYYVPVFNHPYSSYLPSPSASVVLPVNLHSDTDSSLVGSSCENAVSVDSVKTSEISQVNCEEQTSHQKLFLEEKTVAAKNISEGEDITDCNSSSDYPNSKSVSSSPDYIPEIITEELFDKRSLDAENVKQTEPDSSRCWADLFKKPHTQINGIDHQQRPVKVNTIDKDELYTNGNTSTSDVH